MPGNFWPLASCPDIFASNEDNIKDIDVLFIGNKYGARGEIIDYIINQGIKIDCYGDGWENGYVNANQMADLSKRARIILGIGLIGHTRDTYTLKLRDFDALMSGALYLTHRNPDLIRLFKEGEEIEYYSKPKEAYKKIKFYLEHPLAAKAIAKEGFKKALLSHTWIERLSSTFKLLQLIR